MSVRGRVDSEPKTRPDGNPLAGDRNIVYLFNVDSDSHAIPAATKVFEQDFLRADNVDMDASGSRVTFSLREFVTVELGETETDHGHNCTCGDYDPQSPCSHVYWAWDHIVRRQSYNGTNSNLTVRLDNSRGVLHVRSHVHEFDPVGSIGGHNGLDAMKDLLEWRADPSLNKDEKLLEYVREFRRCRSRAERSILSMYQPNHLQFPGLGCENYGVEWGHRILADCATELLEQYDQFSAWLEDLQGNVEDHQAGINDAVAAAIVMMRGVLLLPELRQRTMKALNEEEDNNFWSIIQQFFERVRLRQTDTQSRNALAMLTRYIARQPQQPINAEHVVLNYLTDWFNQ